MDTKQTSRQTTQNGSTKPMPAAAEIEIREEAAPYANEPATMENGAVTLPSPDPNGGMYDEDTVPGIGTVIIPAPLPPEVDINAPTTPGEGPNPVELPTVPSGNGNNGIPLPTPPLPCINCGIIGGIGVVPVPGISFLPGRLSYIRFLHAAPDTPNVDIYANGRLIARNISYTSFTEYFRAVPGIYTIQVYGSGRTVRPIFTSRVNLLPNMIYTAAVAGDRANVELEMISDRPKTLNQNTAYMRFINLSPDSGALDLYVNNRLAVSDMEFQEVSNYFTLRPGTYSMSAKIANTQDTVLQNPQATLRGGVAYATYIVGNLYGTPGLQMLIPMEGATYLKF